MSSNSTLYGIGSSGTSLAAVGAIPVIQTRNPSPSDITGPSGPYIIGQGWVNTVAGGSFQLTNISSFNGVTSANWIALGAETGSLDSLSADSGSAFPVGGAIKIEGGTGITTSATGATVTINAEGGDYVSDFTVDTGTNPVVPTGSGFVVVTGGQIAAGTTANVIQTNSLSPNTYTIQVQRSQTAASSTVGDNGVCHFDSEAFLVDSNGFVSLATGSTDLSINANVGSATASMDIINLVVGTGQGTSVFSGSGNTVTQTFTDSNGNTALGNHSLIGATGVNNTSLGASNLTTAGSYSRVTAIGNSVMINAAGNDDIGIGYTTLSNCSGTANVVIGNNSCVSTTTGSSNTACGHNTMQQLITGANNVAVGFQAGSAYTGSESNNICLGYQVAGSASESNAIHIGNSSATSCNIQGIYGNYPSTPQMAIINSDGQMGSQVIPAVSSNIFSGTFSPGISFGGLSVGVTYSAETFGNYIQIGTPGTGNAMIMVSGLISLTSKGSSTGGASITGLPFLAFPLVTFGIVNSIEDITPTTGYGTVIARVTAGNSVAELFVQPVDTNSSNAGLTDTNFTNSSELGFTISYQV